MVSLKDIAASAGVSVATVSKALRNQGDIGEDTKKKIKDIAAELGYMPNAAARSLKTKHSNNIGVLYKEETGYGLKHEYFAGVLQGFKNQAEQLGYDITFINTNENASKQDGDGEGVVNDNMSYLEHCRYRNFDGVVIVCAIFTDPQVKELIESEIPVVTIDYQASNCTSVSSDNTKGMCELVDRAIQKGHTKIAYVHGQKHSFVTQERLSAFTNRMKEKGLEIKKEYMKEAEYKKSEKAAEKTRELLALDNPPSCIFYPDDGALLGGLSVIYEKNLKIPEDIAIAGYDGSVLSDLIVPKLTTIKQDTEGIGNEAAKRLINLIKNQAAETKSNVLERIIVEGQLISGRSL